jgi:hypothetical protein
MSRLYRSEKFNLFRKEKNSMKSQTGRKSLCMAWGVLALAAGAVGARADRAVVVGVNTYTNIQGANLKGCVNDATDMAATLKKYGFTVTLLTDAQATKAHVLAALATLKSAPASERLAFYFAGHGSNSSERGAVLLPSDAYVNKEDNDIKAEDLYQIVEGLPSKSKSVILDSCFSGGMSRSLPAFGGRRMRYLPRNLPGTRGGSKDLHLANDQDDNHNVGGKDVCYLTASRGNEYSMETTFNGQPHGIFTHNLTTYLTGQKEKWGTVQQKVAADVSNETDDLQHPTLTPDFTEKTIFGDGSTPAPTPPNPTPPAPVDNSLWDIYNGDYADSSKLELKMQPNKTEIGIGEKVKFTITAGAPGYLVILERGTSGNINLLSPSNRSIESAAVTAGAQVLIPGADQSYAPDTAGIERLKAILFSSKDLAAQLLAKFPASGTLSRQKMRDLHVVTDDQKAFYTSDVIFEVRR